MIWADLEAAVEALPSPWLFPADCISRAAVLALLAHAGWNALHPSDAHTYQPSEDGCQGCIDHDCDE